MITSVTFTINGSSTTLHEHGFKKTGAGPDVFWFGAEVGLANGDRDDPKPPLDCTYSISINALVDSELDEGTVVPLNDEGDLMLTKKVDPWTFLYHRLWLPSLRIDERDAATVGRLLGEGPELDKLPLWKLEEFNSLVPLPLPLDKDQTGSGLLKFPRVPLFQAALIRHEVQDEGLTEAQSRNIAETIRQWGLCGFFAYKSSQGFKVLQADKELMPPNKHIIYGGYRSTVGGYWPLYGATLPEGVESSGGGNGIGGAQHLADDQMFMASIFTNSDMAWRIGLSHVEATRSYSDDEYWQGARGFARSLNSMCWAIEIGKRYFPGQISHLYDYVDALLDRLEARNETLGGVLSPVLDRGKRHEASHLELNEIEPLLDAFNIPEEERADYAKSGSSWMTMQLFVELRRALHHTPLRSDQHKRIKIQMDMCADFMKACCQPVRLVKNGTAAMKPTLPDSKCCDELAPLARLAEGGSREWAKGVGIRFAGPGLAELILEYPEYAEYFRPALDRIKQICDEDQWWNKKDFDQAALEWLWPMMAIYGYWKD